MSEQTKTEQPKNQAKIGIVLVDNPEAKAVYLYLAQVDDKNNVVASLGVPAKFLVQYLKENEDKLEYKAQPQRLQDAQKGMVV